MATTATVATTIQNLLHGFWSFAVTESLESFNGLSNESVKMHSHALALFLVYLLVHVFLVLGDNSASADIKGKSSSSSLSLRLKTNSRLIELPASTPTSRRFPTSTVNQASTNDELDDSDDNSTLTEPSIEDLELDLEKQCPRSTPAERRRFLVACNGRLEPAATRLQQYLEWHEKYQILQSTCPRIRPTRDRDYDVWVESCLVAMKGCGEVENIVLPRVIRSYQRIQSHNQGETVAPKARDCHVMTDEEGHRIFHIIPAMMDDKLAKQSTYTLAVALYLDRQVDRHSMDTVTICMDVRAGRGWPNTHAVKLVPFMKSSLKLLLPLFPERLHKCVVYPLPSAFYFLWTMISKCMDAVTAAKICVVSGKCFIEAEPPTDKLIAHLGKEPALLLEPARISMFKA
ncbi:CRAL/TRIO domain containing protein [Nitzschia inconspicua]|uniref:CRAL/TRIO domain containing protein n=1 Tax=Nitzschia inconspicua TaxID=303405 RepID=A0A9K3KLW2_9STRA|nr:CRAL/TRIO domain containing protein [Nitzschia inconspicua]